MKPRRPTPVRLRLISLLRGSLVMLSALVGWAVSQSVPLQEGGGPLPADLAFTAPDGRLALLPAGETSVELLGIPGAVHAFPAFSPDGTQIAAIARSATSAQLVVFDLASEARTTPAVWWDMPRRNVIYFDWRDDGKSILTLVSDPATGFTMRQVTPEGHDVLARGAPLFWDQTTQGGLLVHAGPPGPSRLLLLDAQGEEIFEVENPGPFRSPAASPTGDWLAYAEWEGATRRLVVLRTPDQPGEANPTPSLSGTNDRRALGYSGLTAFAWHPTRDVLALTRPTSEAPHTFGPLGGLDAETGLFEAWTDETVIAFWWSTQGERIAVLASNGSGGGQVADAGLDTVLAGGAEFGLPVPSGAGVEAQPQQVQGSLSMRLGWLNPDGGDVTWLGNVQPGRTFFDQYVPFFDQYARSHLAWAPDDAFFALEVIDEQGRSVIGIFDAEEGTVRHLAPGAMPSWSPVLR